MLRSSKAAIARSLMVVGLLAALVPMNVAAAQTACQGVSLTPSNNVQAVLDQHPAGTTFCFAPGTYRLASALKPDSGDKLIGAPGAVLSGANKLTSFGQAGTTWGAWMDMRNDPALGECEGTAQCNLIHRLYLDGVQQQPVTSLLELKPGSYFASVDTDILYFGFDPRGRSVEVTAANLAITGGSGSTFVDNVTVEGFRIEKFANQRRGAISTFGGEGWRIANNEVAYNHGCGIWAGSGSVVEGNFVHHNGQLGLCGQGEDMLVQNNEVSFNNTDGFDPRWEAGGGKWVQTTDLTVRNNDVHDNYGPGLWADWNNVNTLYEGNTVTNNYGEGIFHEISYSATIRDNVVSGHIWDRKGPWGGGITVSSSPNVEIYNNDVTLNTNGISLIQEDRGSGNLGVFQLSNVKVHDNNVRMDRGYTGVSVRKAGYDPKGKVSFYNNDYRLYGSNKTFTWGTKLLGPKGWKALGMDKKGSFILKPLARLGRGR